ncbi:MAG: ABC transporter ATP-binding protein [Alphaproteobacteria bacterium]|jgi:lipoprotein-releasing system ATP-binding protein|nr:ABC transporter ATP-binding protein [Alphaproteobacteria bacterium]MCB1550630.1 ABC transporter ATP-binding protein [Alphaproteobacteria bacterium]MCB9985942.1 ABC transporter ATP-binding protein [Micavibrio sp.]HPQ50206.1 ABC transporter ATP-binding protein [Alphaproteobacteria bacterium]
MLLRAENITKRLEDEAIPVTLVKNANVEINAGEYVAIKGPSGSGKSSLLYLLGLLDRPSAGKIFYNDQDISALSSNKLAKLRLEQMGFVFQFHFLLPEFTALENVMIPMRKLEKLSDSDIKKQAKERLTELGLEDHVHKLPSQLSGGQRQRVAIARALANNPKLILADEPTGNLDTQSSETVQDILQNLVKTHGCSVVVVTHDTEFAQRCDRIITIVDGEIV